MDQGPVLIVSFTAQQIMVVRDVNGKVIEGDPVRFLNGQNFVVGLSSFAIHLLLRTFKYFFAEG